MRRDQEEEGRAALRDVLAVAGGEHLLLPQVVHGYWPASSDGNDVVVWAGPDTDEVAARFTFPRQAASRRLCIADFFRPISAGTRDVIAFQAVTMSDRIARHAAELFRSDRYTEYLYVHGLGVEIAEALAELWHARIRGELGIDGEDADTLAGLFRQGYRGSRYSLGCSACPDLEQRKPLFGLLDARRIGLELVRGVPVAPGAVDRRDG